MPDAAAGRIRALWGLKLSDFRPKTQHTAATSGTCVIAMTEDSWCEAVRFNLFNELHELKNLDSPESHIRCLEFGWIKVRQWRTTDNMSLMQRSESLTGDLHHELKESSPILIGWTFLSEKLATSIKFWVVTPRDPSRLTGEELCFPTQKVVSTT